MSFEPHPLLRNAHLQSMLASSKLRVGRARRVYGSAFETCAREAILDCGDGVRLQAWLSEHEPGPGRDERLPVVIMLSGWEGSAQSAYVHSAGAYLFVRGHDVARLNFRDHGGTHHLNPGIFHACRLEEVVGAVRALCAHFAGRPCALLGFSLGANFALRVALRAPAAGFDLAHVIAVNPPLQPARVTERLDQGPPLYRWYFLRKWRRSLRRKQACFPARYDFRNLLALESIEAMTEHLVRRYTEFDSVDAYFTAYSVPGDALRDLPGPTTIIAAADDPVVPADDVRALPPIRRLTVELQPWGGHCGYVQDLALRAWHEHRVRELLLDTARGVVTAAS